MKFFAIVITATVGVVGYTLALPWALFWLAVAGFKKFFRWYSYWEIVK